MFGSSLLKDAKFLSEDDTAGGGAFCRGCEMNSLWTMGIWLKPDGSPLVFELWVSGKQILDMVEDESIDVELANADGGL